MEVNPAEILAIKMVLEAGRKFGFGNLISHLQTAWAKELIDEFHMDEKSARAATSRDGSGYPFAMQRDILQRGEWDETGERYRKD